jgi:hypothetical protein
VNRLAECTVGPYLCESDDPHAMGRITSHVGPTLIAQVEGDMDSNEVAANADLLAQAYDATLLLAAICAGKARIDCATGNSVAIDIGPTRPTGWRFSDLGPFGTPILTPDLRAALMRAVGIDQPGGGG